MAVDVRRSGLPLFLAALVLAALSGTVGAQPAPPPQSAQPPTAIDRAFTRLYNFDFPGALVILDEASRAEPGHPLPFAVRGVTYLFMELERLHILESQFFMNDDNLVDGRAKQGPDPKVRVQLFGALQEARQRANARLSAAPDDVDALFAMCLSSSVETDYTALVERRTWRSLKLVPISLVYAHKLLARTPPFYDAYLNFGALEYIVGDLPFFIRWFVRYDGVEGNKRRGIEQLKLVARHGRYYGPFARVLLVVASLREKKFEDAEMLTAGLVQEFPENQLFKKELAIVRQQASRQPRR
jgi:hypothetical protein